MTNTTQSQPITPQLRQWIIEQAQAGHSAEAVLRSMLASGWVEDVAIQALETTLQGHLDEQAARQALPAAAAAVPAPRLEGSPLYIEAATTASACCRTCTIRAWWCSATCSPATNATS